jgi:Protein of unknown function (DUF669)
MAQFNFDASQVAPQQSSGPLPAGTYLAHIIESDVAPLKSGNGEGLKLTFEIIDGQFKGRKVWENLNIMHTNEDTQRIAQSQLSALCHAVNVIKVMDTAALHFKPVKINVTVREAQGMYKASNNIKGYESAGGFSAPAAAPAPAAETPAWPTPEQEAAKSKAPAWARKG